MKKNRLCVCARLYSLARPSDADIIMVRDTGSDSISSQKKFSSLSES